MKIKRLLSPYINLLFCAPTVSHYSLFSSRLTSKETDQVFNHFTVERA